LFQTVPMIACAEQKVQTPTFTQPESSPAPKYGTMIPSRIFVGGIDFKVRSKQGMPEKRELHKNRSLFGNRSNFNNLWQRLFKLCERVTKSSLLVFIPGLTLSDVSCSDLRRDRRSQSAVLQFLSGGWPTSGGVLISAKANLSRKENRPKWLMINKFLCFLVGKKIKKNFFFKNCSYSFFSDIGRGPSRLLLQIRLSPRCEDHPR